MKERLDLVRSWVRKAESDLTALVVWGPTESADFQRIGSL